MPRRRASPPASSWWRTLCMVLVGVAVVEWVAVSRLGDATHRGVWANPRVQQLILKQEAPRAAEPLVDSPGAEVSPPGVANSGELMKTRKEIKVKNGSHVHSAKEGPDAVQGSIETEALANVVLTPSASPSTPRPPYPHDIHGVDAAGPSSRSTHKASTGGRVPKKGALGLHAFYYAWYGNPEMDGKWLHWDHEVLKHWGGPAVNAKFPTVGSKHKPPQRIGSNYFPELGPYSSRNATVVNEHVQMMAESGIGVLVYSWWGRGLGDANGDPTDESIVEEIARACEHHGVKFAFHLEPYAGRTAASVGLDLVHLLQRYGNHSALYRMQKDGQRLQDGKPVFYVYDSYHTSPAEWSTVLGRHGAKSIRGGKYDCIVLGLWVEAHHGEDLRAGGFDGMYSYFATDGMTFGRCGSCLRANLEEFIATATVAYRLMVQAVEGMQEFARQHKMIFVPSIGPGYIDTAIRPWNAQNTREREDGAYYARGWKQVQAMQPPPSIVSLTSFNEWHEGTQLEPAAARRDSYLDYGNVGPRYYLEETRKRVDECLAFPARPAWCRHTVGGLDLLGHPRLTFKCHPCGVRFVVPNCH